ncbi:hypothetical protein C0993_006184 [Termitomyces sp. T159_Od127]|nr:hypothetical protein C0993_006184 [Termitomyces sp. T159_Od127]
MSCDQAEVQPQIAEDLWLQRKLSSLMATSPPPEICREAYQRLVLSDTIALYLTTDDRDGVVAACYMPQDAILFLAKSGSSDSSYIAESKVFFRELANANGFEDLLPFLARRSCNRVNKRIRKLRHYYKMFGEELLREARKYEPTDTEFSGPWYRKFVQIAQTGNQLDKLSFKQILLHVLTFCKEQLENNIEFSDKPESHRQFAALLYAASALLNSDFYPWLENENCLSRLGRQLEKITDYLRVSRLIKVWRRYGQDTNIKWIADVEQSEVPRTLATAGVGERHLEAIYWRNVHQTTDDYRPYLFRKMDWRFPGWKGEASETITFVPCMHAEIRLILYLMGSFGNLQTRHDETIPIGCGQRSCFACTLWIYEFNRVLQMKWTTRRNNGPPRYDCALPRAEAIVPYVGAEGYQRITSYVHQGIRDAIAEVIREQLGDAVEDYVDDYFRRLRNSP